MPARLGEMLLKAGMLNKAQLAQVLDVQSVYGGRLGTNLVEMGLVGEEDLAHLLHEKLGVPYLDPAALDAIDKDLLRLVPQDMIRRYRVLPVAREGEKLLVAMADPTDQQALAEIGFVTGLVVVPRLCAELRLSVALEHHCGVTRAARYIPARDGAERLPGRAPDGNGCGEVEREAEGAGRAGQRLPEIPGPAFRVAKVQESLTLAALADTLAAVSGEGEVVAALLAYLGGNFQRGAFLGLKRASAQELLLLGIGTEACRFPGEGIALADAEQLLRVVQGRCSYLGELAAAGGDGRLGRALGGEASQPALLVPLAVAGQVVAVLCAKDQPGRLAAGEGELQQVANLAELALEMLCIRKRIRPG